MTRKCFFIYYNINNLHIFIFHGADHQISHYYFVLILLFENILSKMSCLFSYITFTITELTAFVIFVSLYSPYLIHVWCCAGKHTRTHTQARGIPTVICICIRLLWTLILKFWGCLISKGKGNYHWLEVRNSHFWSKMRREDEKLKSKTKDKTKIITWRILQG